MTGGSPRAATVPDLTIVVAARPGTNSPGACMDALRPQLVDGVEVVLVGDDSSAANWPWATTLGRDEMQVPELWAEGIAVAEGRLVGLLTTTAVPGDDWVALTRHAHDDGTAAVGGPIEPGPGFRIVDWAVYFCRYASYLTPLPPTPLEVPGDNASYRMDVLAGYRSAYADGFWEPFVHDLMRADGHDVVVGPDRVVWMRPGSRVGRFSRQRFSHGRAHGRRRSTGQRGFQLLVGMLSTPAVPLVMTARVARTMQAKRRLRGRFLIALPLVVWFYSCWAAGELSGRLDAAGSRR